MEHEESTASGIHRSFEGAGFPAFALSLVGCYEAGLLWLLLTPGGDSALGTFAEEFRVWCFGYDPATGELDAAYVSAMVGPPLLLVSIIVLMWWEPLRRSLRRPAELLLPAALGLILAGGSVAGLTLVAGPPDAGELPFPAEALRTSQPTPELRLVNQLGSPVDLAAFRGEVVLLTGVYAACPHTCPLILDQARRAIDALGPEAISGLRLIAVTLDPAHDSPEVLEQLASRHGLEAPVYNLVTGDADRVNRVLDELGIERHLDPLTGLIDHPNLFVLVDRNGRVAYRLGLGERQERWLVSALKVLLQEQPGSPPGVG